MPGALPVTRGLHYLAGRQKLEHHDVGRVSSDAVASYREALTVGTVGLRDAGRYDAEGA
jgi:hypothetical protein